MKKTSIIIKRSVTICLKIFFLILISCSKDVNNQVEDDVLIEENTEADDGTGVVDDAITEDDTTAEMNGYTFGKNHFNIDSNGDLREYYVHVPTNYNEGTEIPVVFMLHGTSGNGEKFYNISGWKELGETENILTVYPSSWEYCKYTSTDLDLSSSKITTKWNVLEDDAFYCTGENPRDDVQFLRAVINELNETFNINNKKLYLVGFSNGGGMAFQCAVEMSDVFAAIVESGWSANFEATYIPKRDIPMTYQMGNADNKDIAPLPMESLDSLLQTPAFKNTVLSHTNSFNLENIYTLSGDPKNIVTATYKGTSSNPMEFKVSLIKDLEHNYPNGTNHPMDGAKINWEWLKQFTLPD